MTDDESGRTFLSRWSRRKIAARTGRDLPEAPPAAGANAGPVADANPDEPREAQPPPADLPDVETLDGLKSEYREFLRPEVDESLRRTALKKLFADPHFNVMDGLDVYIDDYSKPDPIPAAMLRALNQARGLFLFDEESADGASRAGDAAQQGDPAPAGPEGATLGAAEIADLTNCPEPAGLSQSDLESLGEERKTG